MKLSLTPELVRNFAKVAEDFNPLHLSLDFAKKSRFRQPIVHGMLPLMALASIENEFQELSPGLLSINTEFIEPVFSCEVLEFSYFLSGQTNEREFTCLWKNSKNKIVTKATGTMIFDTLPALPANSAFFFPEKTPKCSHTPQTIQEASTSLSLTRDENKLSNFEELFHAMTQLVLKKGPLTSQMSILLGLSPLVGINLPGEFGIFLGFEMSFKKQVPNTNYLKLEAKVDSFFSSSGKLRTEVFLKNKSETIVHGFTHALLSEAPPQVIKCVDLKRQTSTLDLAEKSVLVVGASGGIGAATAKLLAMNGAKVAVHYFQGKNDAQLIVEDIQQNQGQAIAIQGDVRVSSEMNRLVSDLEEKWGTIDCLIYCAISDYQFKSFFEIDSADYQSEFEMSVKGLHEVCKSVIPLMQRKGAGKIIALSSIVTEIPVTGQNKYITMKSALTGYIRSLAVEFAPDNIQSNLIVPDITDTTLIASIPPSLLRRLKEERPNKRILEPIDIAKVIGFLCSSWSNTISGQRIVLNGGRPPFL